MTVAGPDPAPPRARFNPFSAEFRRDPYPMYRDLRAVRPVHRTLGMWVLTRYTDVKAVLHDRSFSAGLIPQLVSEQADRLGQPEVGRIARLGRKSLVFTDNPDHARLRGLVNRVFTAAAVAELRPVAEAASTRLLEHAADAGGMDLIRDFAAPLPIAVLCEWMALPDELRAQVGPWTHDIRFLLEPGLMKAADFARVREVVEDFATALTELVAQRREHPGGDLISRLLTARTSGGDTLTEEELVFVCIMCFVAGNETTKSLIGNGTLALLRHPDQAALLRDDPTMVKAAVAEALRYDCPLQLTKRLATRDVLLGDQLIHAGEQVLVCLGAANRDPAMYERPDEFDLTRDASAHLAFGHGMHGCLGGQLAELVTGVAFGHLAGLRLEPLTDDFDWQDHSFIVRGLKRLPVTVRREP
ncbi:cytochrome P450 [Nocardia sp. NBC_00511]|uniref:cytochrome P450 n=1 Tax=Nocardia sp. NBC_00511 TaxID=2903591 RepID=UPI0030E2066D